MLSGNVRTLAADEFRQLAANAVAHVGRDRLKDFATQTFSLYKEAVQEFDSEATRCCEGRGKWTAPAAVAQKLDSVRTDGRRLLGELQETLGAAGVRRLFVDAIRDIRDEGRWGRIKGNCEQALCCGKCAATFNLVADLVRKNSGKCELLFQFAGPAVMLRAEAGRKGDRQPTGPSPGRRAGPPGDSPDEEYQSGGRPETGWPEDRSITGGFEASAAIVAGLWGFSAVGGYVGVWLLLVAAYIGCEYYSRKAAEATTPEKREYYQELAAWWCDAAEKMSYALVIATVILIIILL